MVFDSIIKNGISINEELIILCTSLVIRIVIMKNWKNNESNPPEKEK